MIQERTRIGVALVGLAVVSALVVVFLARDRGGGDGSAPTADEAPAIEARATLTPRVMEFGDTLRASIDVTLDPSRVDPASVRVRTVFSPWRQVESPEVVRRIGEMTSFRTTYVLRCLTNACPSKGDVASVFRRFTEATVTYAPRADGAATSARRTTRVAWPGFLVRARFTQQAAQSGGPTPWLADLEALPAATYSMAPGRLLALLLAASAVLAVVGGVLAYVARPHPDRPARPVAEPPRPLRTPLEQALALLEDPARVNGAGDQRRALELVASALAERGDTTLAQAARALAWSAPVPGARETGGVAARARTALGEEEHASSQ